MKKAVTYKEPKDYFTPEMLKVAKEMTKAQAKKESSAKNTKPASGKK